jgi:dihydropyrimidinase
MYDLLINNGLVVTENGESQADVAVSDGKIAAVIERGGNGTPVEAGRTIDADGKLVLPGAIDPHVHYGLEFAGCVSEGSEFSLAAAAGGTTTIIDFAVHTDEASAHDAIAAKRAQHDGTIALDYGLHVILTGEIPFEVIEEIPDLVREGYPTIKTMMTYGWMADDGYRWGVMNAVAEAGGLSVVHAEDDAIANWLTKKYVREGKTHGAYIGETRGSVVEEAAVRRALFLAERSGSPLYILHMAAADGVDALAEARSRGLPFYGETLTPYLSFTGENLWEEERGLLYNNYPTLKTQDDQDRLWSAVQDNRLQVISSDHFLIKAVDRNSKMGTKVDDGLQCGQAGVELRMPVSYSLGVATGRLSLTRFVQVIATNPAKIMGLYPQKGTIAVGSDADVVVFDPEKRWTVDVPSLHMDTDYSLWEGWELTGKPQTVIQRGVVLVEDEQVVGPTDGGRFIPRSIPSEIRNRPLDPSLTRGGALRAEPALA